MFAKEVNMQTHNLIKFLCHELAEVLACTSSEVKVEKNCIAPRRWGRSLYCEGRALAVLVDFHAGIPRVEVEGDSRSEDLHLVQTLCERLEGILPLPIGVWINR